MVALALPLISFVYSAWGFDALFRVLAFAALVILVSAASLPASLPIFTPGNSVPGKPVKA